MSAEHQRNQGEETRHAAEDKRLDAELKRLSAEHNREDGEEHRNNMESIRPVAEEMRDTREQMRVEEGKEQHTSFERRMALIGEHLRRLDERFTHLEQHLLQHGDTLHQASRIQEDKNKEHSDHARHTVESSKQKIKETGKLIERAQGRMRKCED
jgi:hypothetical protein